jgi:23S rRNA pseudouridine2605 synthase
VSEEGERLQKVLARAGIGSRRAVEDLIRQGRVRVNDTPARLGQRVDPSRDQVALDGSRVPLSADLVSYLVNKPAGVVTTAADEAGRVTVLDLLGIDARVWPVGRLDMDSEGALILTNDGDLTLGLTHPRFEVSKTYVAEVRGPVDRRTLKDLTRGVELADGRAAAVEARLTARSGGNSMIELTLREGRNRQVRRMLERVGHPVVRLVRTGVGPVRLGRLKSGTMRRLSDEEIRALYRACGM